MKLTSRIVRIGLVGAFAGAALVAKGAGLEGLQMHCHPEKASFAMGEPLVFRCVVTNTTDLDKRMSWYLSLGNQFHFATDETNWFSGLVPEVAPQLRPPAKLESSAVLLPPHSSFSLRFVTKTARPGHYRWIAVYDPDTHGGGFFGEEAFEKAKKACIFSNPFEYEVTAAGRKP